MQDVEFESAVVTCQPAQKTTTAKRRRAAEVHNRSERVDAPPFPRARTFPAWLNSAPRSFLCCANRCKISVQRRRDRINEKMKALQELIPHCNKVIADPHLCTPISIPCKLATGL
jgi:phytochrome-interacting factor 4